VERIVEERDIWRNRTRREALLDLTEETALYRSVPSCGALKT
jgi:hypothetical protein